MEGPGTGQASNWLARQNPKQNKSERQTAQGQEMKQSQRLLPSSTSKSLQEKKGEDGSLGGTFDPETKRIYNPGKLFLQAPLDGDHCLVRNSLHF